MAPPASPPDNSASRNLIQLLRSLVQQIPEPIFLFVIAVLVVILLADVIGGIDLVVELRVLVGVLTSVAIIAVLISKLYPSFRRVFKRQGGVQVTSSSLDRIQLLRKQLESLTSVQFQELISETLTPSEQDDLTPPVTKSSYLNDMNRWRKLGKVERYLGRKFPEEPPEVDGEEGISVL
jgi:hypothetical protein